MDEELVDYSHAGRYEALLRVLRAISVYREPKELFRVLVAELWQAVDFDFVGLFLYNEALHAFENPILETVRGRGIVIPGDFPPEETITWWIYQNQKPVVIPSTEEETRFPKMMKVYKEQGVRAACLLPLTTSHRRLGSLGFGMNRPQTYTADEVNYLSLVADQVALAVDNAMGDQEQRTVQEELNKQKEHFEKLFELAPEAIVLRDRDNRVLRVNKEFTRLFGFQAEEALGRNITDLIVPEEYREESEKLRDMPNRGERVNAELVRQKKDGTRIVVSFAAAPVRAKEGQAEIYGIYRDITKWKEKEEALEKVLSEINALKNQLLQENVALRQEIDETSMFDDIVGRSAALQRMLKEIETVGPTDSTVLIHGETGTGKELIARAIHNRSSRRDSAFVKVNCAAIPRCDEGR